METLIEYLLTFSKYAIIGLSVVIIVRCLRSMLNERYDSETWGYIRFNDEMIPINHWENIIGKGSSADIRIYGTGISRVHAVLSRSDRGVWRIYDIFSRGGVWVNGVLDDIKGARVKNGDIINLAGHNVEFVELNEEHVKELEGRRFSAGRFISPAVTLIWLTVFEGFLLLELIINSDPQYSRSFALSFLALILLQWLSYTGMRVLERTGFEIETIAFYLTALGLCVAASSTPGDIYKQVLLIAASVALFWISGWWLRNLKRTELMRIPVALLALILLAVNYATSDEIGGARNWLTFGGYSFQPSELVKVFYIYAGASTLDKLYRKNNLYVFAGFSAVCVVALALMGDFGTALVFFVCFLVISFMRSGSIATVILAISGAVMAGLMAITAKPYIARRFETWGHAWEDVYDTGYQQVRAMSAAAAGGLFGKGAGNGWLKGIVAANTDMVFGIICEELGLITACCAVLAVIVLAVFAVRSAAHSRSAYHSIAACAVVTMLITQLALNIFGSMDLLPFTGVTFPFVSRGGSSLISCWMLMAYIKCADNRRDASFAVKAADSYRPGVKTEDRETDDYTEDDYYIPEDWRQDEP